MMGMSYAYPFKTKKEADKAVIKLIKIYKDTGKTPEVHVYKQGREWIVRDYGVEKDKKKKWWQFWK